MAKGHENLVPVTERTKDEQRKIASMGGKASGKARAEKAKLKQTLKLLLDNTASNLTGDEISRLEALGADTTNRGRLAVALFDSALKGNPKAIQLLSEIVEEFTPKQQMEVDGGLDINISFTDE